MQLLVLGMHRSGTSSLARLLNLAGAYFGPEGIATDPNSENPKGFWERRDVRAVCDGLLHGGGYDWWKIAGFSVDNIPQEVRDLRLDEFRNIVYQLDAHRPWVMKEPRLCLLLPILRPALEAPVYVHVVREPLEIAESLATRNRFPIPVGLGLWEAYTISAFSAAGTEPSVIVSFTDLLRDPVATTTRLIEQLDALGVQGLRTPSEREVAAFVDDGLYHERQASEARDGYLNAQQVAWARQLDRLDIPAPSDVPKLSTGAAAALAAFEASEARIAELELEQASAMAQQAETEAEHNELVQAHEQLDAKLRRLEQSLTAKIEFTQQELDAHSANERQLLSRAAARRRAEQHASDSLAAAARRVKMIRESRSVRMGIKAAKARDLVSGHRSRGVDPSFQTLLNHIEEARAAIRDPADNERTVARTIALDKASDDVTATEDLRRQRTEARQRGRRAKVAVLTWDVGHNPFGRAHLLADLLRDRFDVELWGAQFDRYGSDIWLPLRDTEIPIRRYPGADFPEFFEMMSSVARRIDADAIYVSKPRFPGLGIGVMAKEFWNRPLILDVDDFEPAFFKETRGLDPNELRERDADPDLALPHGRLWTCACESVLSGADVLTVSNAELQHRYGGSIVPHARDEAAFDPSRFDRNGVRARLGLTRTDRMILFGGTPRVHKGILQLLEAVDRLGDERVCVGLFESRELAELRRQIGDLDHWIVPVPFHAFGELPNALIAADLAVALQSPDHPVSRYQMPAKITDAMAMGVPCLVTPVPPLQPLIDKDVLEVFDGDVPLDERLRDFFARPDDAKDRALRAREVFLESYSYSAVRPVVAAAIERHLDDPPPLTRDLGSIVKVARDLFAPPSTESAREPSPRRRIPAGSTYDLVVFWKQNDTGIYGRRQDMFLKYLERSGRFAKIVHFDHPMSVEGLLRTAQRGIGSGDQNRLVARQTLRRMIHREDRGAVRNRTFVYGAGRASKAMKLPMRSEYVKYVRSVLEREQIGKDRPVVFWVYPTNNFFPTIADRLAPDIVVADVVDDNRTWYEPGTPMFEKVNENYAKVLERADIVLANCDPVALTMKEFTSDVHVVPNACELPGEIPAAERPRELRGLTGPVIGYAGNLSGRLDIKLLKQLARTRRDWNFVFVGSTHLDRSALELVPEPNVRLIGTKRYEDAQAIISHFDVAMIPHLDNEMSRSMNPLKAYVYCSLGVPIVSSPVANLDQLAEFITFADGPEEFIRAIEVALREGRRAPDRDALLPHSWDVRVEQVLGLIDETVARYRENAT
jgi:glycosyltransferase involved in cell wall biosynthesis